MENFDRGCFEGKQSFLAQLRGRADDVQSATQSFSYVREGEELLVISQKDRTWWKNLRGGAPVMVTLQGHTWHARGETLTNTDLAAHILLQILQHVRAYQQFLHVKLDATG